MEPDPISIVDLSLLLFCPIDDALPRAKHPQAKLEVSERVRIGVWFSLKGGSFGRFYRWLTANLNGCFPEVPQRSRLQHRLLKHQAVVAHFLAQPSLFCVADSYGVELGPPIREFQPPKGERIGAKGKSNRRWIHGMKVLLVLNDQDQVVRFAWASTNVHDQTFNLLLAQYNQHAIVLVDLGYRHKNRVPECLKLCAHKTWGERMSIERLFSQLTRFTAAKKRNHRTESGFTAWWAYLVVALNLIASSSDLCLAQAVL